MVFRNRLEGFDQKRIFSHIKSNSHQLFINLKQKHCTVLWCIYAVMHLYGVQGYVVQYQCSTYVVQYLCSTYVVLCCVVLYCDVLRFKWQHSILFLAFQYCDRLYLIRL